MASPADVPGNDILLRVRQETRSLHEQLEAQLPLDDSLTMGRYQELLAKFWGLFDPLERALISLDLSATLEVHQRQRSNLLVRDLSATGFTAAELASLPLCCQIPELNSRAAALGCMYVLEGSRLGGQYVSRLVVQKLALTEHAGCSFFSSDGAEVGPMWRKFCDIVRGSLLAAGEQQEFIAAARSTFSAFVWWLGRSNAQLV